MGRIKKSIGHQLKHYCYMLNIAEDAGVKPCGYQLQKALGLLPSQLNQEKVHRKNKWDRYFYYKDKVPSKDSIKEIQKRFKKSTYILSLPLWEILDIPHHDCVSIINELLKMPANIKRHIFQLHSPYELKTEITSRSIEVIERLGNEHALACLLGLFTLNANKKITLFLHGYIEHPTERLLKRCCLSSPLNMIKAELHDEIGKYINALYCKSNDYIIFESTERFLYQVENLEIVFNFLKAMHITERKTNVLELTYWLVKGNDLEILEDCRRINNKLPLIKKKDGLLWLFESMMFKSKGVMRDRLNFLYTFYLKGDYSKYQR